MKYSRYFTQKLKEATFNLNCRCRPNILKCSRQIVFEVYVLILKCLEVKDGDSWNDLHTESTTTEY